MAVVVHCANIQDRDGAKLVFKRIDGLFPRLTLIWADGAYAGKLIEWVKAACDLVLKIIKRPKSFEGFQVLYRRWIAERTFGWFNRYRRLSKDYEYLNDTSESMIYIAMSQLQKS